MASGPGIVFQTGVPRSGQEKKVKQIKIIGDLIMYNDRRNQAWIPSIFGDLFDDFAVMPAKQFASPAVNIKETDKDYNIQIAAPGMTKDDFKININEYNELALVYKLSPLKTFFLIKLPQVKSYLYSALDSIFGLSWKAVIAGEVLCLPKNALGSYIQKQSLHLESANVIAATLLLILFCFLIQKFVHFLFSCKENHNQL